MFPYVCWKKQHKSDEITVPETFFHSLKIWLGWVIWHYNVRKKNEERITAKKKNSVNRKVLLLFNFSFGTSFETVDYFVHRCFVILGSSLSTYILLLCKYLSYELHVDAAAAIRFVVLCIRSTVTNKSQIQWKMKKMKNFEPSKLNEYWETVYNARIVLIFVSIRRHPTILHKINYHWQSTVFGAFFLLTKISFQ